MPCLNEAETLGYCVEKALRFLQSHNISGEVLIADNGSTDGSQDIARKLGARVLDAPVRGYGAALSHGIAAAKGRYVIMGDSDGSYDFSNLMPFIAKLREDYDLVMGNRFKGKIAKGAMPPLHQYLGNPILTFIGRLFFGKICGDFHCGMRGFGRNAMLGLDLRTTGMEFASEMIVKSALHKLRITEVPTTLAKDGRSRPPYLRTWRDGWRHLRFLLMYSPRWLFLYPGLTLFLLGLIGMVLLIPGALHIGGIAFDVHSLLLSGIAMILGSQILLFAFLAKQSCLAHGLLPPDPKIEMFFGEITLERSLMVGFAVAFMGGLGMIASAVVWSHHRFGVLDYEAMMRLIVPASVALVIGLQIVFGAFLAGIIGLATHRREHN